MINNYSTQQISKHLLDEILHALKTVSPFGSVEIFIQNNTVTQITMRNIKKTGHDSRPVTVRPGDNYRKD
ncbi:hypothetical protein A2Z33_00960 [Candidatus Gottesmanbacteria bacterium RBG_16_52_11]|uniref:DUF2292 domain-containing protein n=1 Tax=Candidatus Gottesmanbacteria bacterium RBG_16_52_11 TaxID=1798374 RepID=A0A1F5YP36_9BACT|nr:MAG: hypothetical protein A2Z33_00960 [Candidatus Gottesmanbacteria bacterium RBG_16_52_11]